MGLRGRGGGGGGGERKGGGRGAPEYFDIDEQGMC